MMSWSRSSSRSISSRCRMLLHTPHWLLLPGLQQPTCALRTLTLRLKKTSATLPARRQLRGCRMLKVNCEMQRSGAFSLLPVVCVYIVFCFRKYRDLPCAMAAQKCSDAAIAIVKLMEEKVELIKLHSSRVFDAQMHIEKSITRTSKYTHLSQIPLFGSGMCACSTFRLRSTLQ